MGSRADCGCAAKAIDSAVARTLRDRRSSPSKRRRVTFAGVVARLAGALLILWAAGLAWFMLAQPGPAPLTVQTDGVVVLTGGPQRIARGIAVLSGGSAQRMLVSGVDPAVTQKEFKAAAGLSASLLECCVELGQVAATTRGNAAEVAEFVERHQLGSIRLVTAGYHMRRARAEVRALLPAEVEILPDAVAAPLSPLRLLGEYHKLLAAHLLLLGQRWR